MRLKLAVFLVTAALVIGLTLASFFGFVFLNAKLVDAFTERDIPENLVLKLRHVTDASTALLAQHGLHHDEFLSPEEMRQGAALLQRAGLAITYYVPPYESDHNLDFAPFPVLKAKAGSIPEVLCREGICVERGLTTLLRPSAFTVVNLAPQFRVFPLPLDPVGSLVHPEPRAVPLTQVVVHIQDPLSNDFLDWATAGQRPDLLRVDDINTDIVDVRAQIDRINIAEDYCVRTGCQLILAVIPLVERRTYSILSGNVLLAFSTAIILALYLFYFLSYALKRPAAKAARVLAHAPNGQRRHPRL